MLHFIFTIFSGIVFGALDSEGRIDAPRMKLIRELSKGTILTFHRAFDVCSSDSTEALDLLISLGCDRLLTSGGPQCNVLLNVNTVKELHNQAKGKIEIVAAAGVSEQNAAELLLSSGVSAVHAGSSVCCSTPSTPLSDAHSESSASSPKYIPDSFGTESYVDVNPVSAGGLRISTPTLSGPSLSPVHSKPGSKNKFLCSSVNKTAVFELVSWSRVDELAVNRLVEVVKRTIAARVTGVPNLGREVSPDPSAENGYVHL